MIQHANMCLLVIGAAYIQQIQFPDQHLGFYVGTCINLIYRNYDTVNDLLKEQDCVVFKRFCNDTGNMFLLALDFR